MANEEDGNLGGLEYTYGYFSPLSPSFLSLCALNKGVHFDAENPKLRYLELGFGQGVSLVVHAAAREGEFWGNDIGPGHVAHAKKLAATVDADIHILPDSFKELIARQDLRQFDVITLHGIWTWISEEDGQVVIELAKRFLAPGGLLYITYNCAAGWAAATELRQLLIAYAKYASAPETPANIKVQQAMLFAGGLASAGSAYFRANPTVGAQLQAVAGRDTTYLAHEFLGDHWRLSSFYEVATRMQSAGLEFVGSALLLEHGDRFTLDERGRAVIANIHHPILREMAVECMINPQFRQDVFVKQPVLLSVEARRAAFMRKQFMLTVPLADAALTIPGPQGPVALERELYEPLLAALAARAHAPKRLAEISAMLPGVDPEVLIEAVIVLAGAGYVQPAMDAPSERARSQCRALNDHLCARARQSGDLTVLASPVLGAGARVTRAEQLFLLARAAGVPPEDWADYAVAEAQVSSPVADLRAKLVAASATFETQTLPILIAAGVA